MKDKSELNGIVILDKPVDMSSAHAVKHIKDLLRVKKAGHAGTLDPMATGLLVCCLNKATKLARFFLKDKKGYHAVLRLGVETDTQDATGDIIATSSRISVSEADIRSTFKTFEGDIEQSPPVFSALKHQGIPLYRYARKGIRVQKPPRSVSIYKLSIQNIELPYISFDVACSAGTYIRTLCADIGKRMGCGGHLYALRRTESSGFTIDEAIVWPKDKTPQALDDMVQGIIPMADALKFMPAAVADKAILTKIRYGQKIMKRDLAVIPVDLTTPFIKVVDRHHRLAAVMQTVPNEKTLKYSSVFV